MASSFTQDTGASSAATPEVNITLKDLNIVVEFMEVAISRGAARAAEMAIVGAVYDRLRAFIAKRAQDASTSSSVDNGKASVE